MIIRRGTFKGFNWFVRLSAASIKCAYVLVPNELFKSLEQIIANIDLHGGCTYFDSRFPDVQIAVPESHIVIGWDYGHYTDIKYQLINNYVHIITVVSDDDIIKDIADAIEQIEAYKKKQS